jgi:sec-independent protein translocase protein TatB
MFDLSFDKLIVLGFVAVMIIGPTRLPQYAARLARFIRSARSVLEQTKERAREEMGPGFDDIEWKKLDPRQYDPRRIIRDALFDDSNTGDENVDEDVVHVRPSESGTAIPRDEGAE